LRHGLADRKQGDGGQLEMRERERNAVMVSALTIAAAT